MTRKRNAPDFTKDQVEAAGFQVEVASEGYTDSDGTEYPTTYRVIGHGANMVVSEDATEVWEELVGHADAAKGITPSAPEEEHADEEAGA